MEKNLAFKTMENMDKNSESIILFDSISDLDDLDKISSKHTSKIISFDAF